MKLITTTVLLAVLGAAPAFAEPQTWRGQITDSKCGAKHRPAEHGQTMSDLDCTKACTAEGAQYVFATKRKIYRIANQHNSDVLMHAGHVVNLTGELKGDTITVLAADMP